MNWQPIETAPKTGEYLVIDKFGSVWLIEAETGYPKANGCGCCADKIYDAVLWAPVETPN